MYTFYMNTKFVGIKEFRKNISSYAQKAQSQKERFIVMNRNTPLFEIKSFSDGTDLTALFGDIKMAQNDIKRGDVYSHAEVLEMLS